MQAGFRHARALAVGLLAVVATAGADPSASSPSPAGAEPGVTRPAASGLGAGGVLVPISGAIGPATSDFFVRAVEGAQESGASLIVVTLDTPGGLDTSMREMIQAILASEVPVAVYVSPSGARAASAGTYLLYASHVAAMAPATNLGAATPVQIGGPAGEAAPGPAPEPAAAKDAGPAIQPGSTMERKVVNDAAAYIRSLAELRGRNVEWAEAAVREGASLSANDALKLGVIDLIADDLADLVTALDGRVVKLHSGEVTLRTAGLPPLRTVEQDWRTRLLSIVTNPNIAYLLLLIGIYGLLLEGFNPGAVLPGVVGAICLLLALFAFQVLSVNFAGLALIALGVLLIVAESFVPSFGALGLGGIVAFVIGSVMLMNEDIPGLGIAWQLIGAMSLVGALLLLAIVSFAVRARRRPVVTGGEGLLAERAVAIEAFNQRGLVRVHGELWNATSRAPVLEGQRLRILGREGLTLQVEPDPDR